MIQTLEQFKKITFRIAIVGGVSIVLAINSIPYIYAERIRKTEHYKKAMQLLRSHPEAVKYLGEPIEEKRVNCTSREDFGTDEKTMWVRVPVKGSLDNGKLYYEYSLKEQNDSLLRVELTLSKLKNHKLVIKKEN